MSFAALVVVFLKATNSTASEVRLPNLDSSSSVSLDRLALWLRSGARIVFSKELLSLGARAEQRDALNRVIKAKYSNQLAVPVINGAARETILPLQLRG